MWSRLILTWYTDYRMQALSNEYNWSAIDLKGINLCVSVFSVWREYKLLLFRARQVKHDQLYS